MTQEQRQQWFDKAVELARFNYRHDFIHIHSEVAEENEDKEPCPFQIFNAALQTVALELNLTIEMQDTLFAIFECVKLIVVE